MYWTVEEISFSSLSVWTSAHAVKVSRMACAFVASAPAMAVRALALAITDLLNGFGSLALGFGVELGGNGVNEGLHVSDFDVCRGENLGLL